jgi:hypothetical protein
LKTRKRLATRQRCHPGTRASACLGPSGRVSVDRSGASGEVAGAGSRSFADAKTGMTPWGAPPNVSNKTDWRFLRAGARGAPATRMNGFGTWRMRRIGPIGASCARGREASGRHDGAIPGERVGVDLGRSTCSGPADLGR